MQSFVAQKVTKSLNERYDTDINIERLGLSWNGNVAIKNVFIADHHNDTLIYSENLSTSILNFKSLVDGQLFFGSLELENVKLHIKTYQGEQNDNLSVFSKKFAPETPDPNSPPFILKTPTLSLINADIKLTDENLETPEVMHLTNLSLQSTAFEVYDSDVTTNIQSLKFTYNNEVEVSEMSAKFSYTANGIDLNNLILQTSKGTHVDADISLQTGENGFADFENTVVFDALFRDTTIKSDDIALFYDGLGKNQTIRFSTDFKGTLNNFELRQLNFSNQETTISGNFQFTDLLHPENDFNITLTQHHIYTNYYDLRRLLPQVLGDVLPKELANLGKFTFTGTTNVTGENLDLDATLVSSVGNVKAVLGMGNINDVANTSYKGTVRVQNFDIGKLTETQEIGKISAMLNFEGKGFTQETVNTEVSGTISSFYFNHYDYKNISISGFLKKPLFNGSLEVNDPNLQLTFDGLVDVSEDLNHYDFKTEVNYADLNKINLVSRDSISIFTGSVEIDMKGTNVDDVVGTINVTRSTYQNLIDDYFFDDVTIVSSFEGEERTIEIISPDIATGAISGRFFIEDLPNLFQNSIGSIYANYVPLEVITNQYVDFNFEIFNKIVEVFVPEIKFGDNTTIRGSVSSDESQFKLSFRSPEIEAFDKYIKKISLQIDNNNPLFNTYVEIDSINAGFYQVSDFNMINITMKDTLFVRSEFKGGSEKQDIFNLSMYHTINEMGKSVVGMKRSDVIFKENQWVVNVENDTLNKVSFDNNFRDIILDKFILSHQDESVQLSGVLRDSTYKDINLHFKDVDIAKITPEIDSLHLSGIVNGDFSLLQEGVIFKPESNVTIDNFEVNDIPFGRLDLKVLGSDDLSIYSVNASLRKDAFTTMSAVGLIEITETASLIDIDLQINELNLEAFSPMGGEIFTDIRGLVSGRTNIVGNLLSPELYGSITLVNTGMRIPLLNIDFVFDNSTSIEFDKYKFSIPNTQVTDTKYDTNAIVSGYFEHIDFADWTMDLDINTNRFLVLDTQQDEESLYYGTAFIDGVASITGPIDELVIDVAATTGENTTFKIPISDTHSIGDDSFIYFLSPSEKQARVSGEEFLREELKGLSLNFDLDITRDAEVEIVVDVKNNSTLKGRGEGTLFIEINTLGRFNMWGDFQVYEAQYNFKYGAIVQKQFQVERGGNISWNGRPERARLDLKAVYNTMANPSVLLDNPTINRKIPVQAAIILQGDLVSPNFEWEINFPNVSSIVKSEIEFKLDDRQQRELQVLYLVATGSFSSPDMGLTRDQGTQTLVEGVSGLVNDIFADEDGKFNVGLAYTQGTRTPDLETADRVGVSLTTQVSDKVLINGRVGVPIGGVTESTFAGDLEIQLLLNEDGSLKLHFFNREAPIQFIGENLGFEQGTGLSYAIDFDTFKEISNRLFKGKVEIEEETEEPIKDDTKFLKPFEELIDIK
ncbi:MAG TPA: translocation/assembly module TamB domain-containing protein [Flavobacteriaceae bacterium]|nr:translocation/assembly module TamB domain-containing protein [Flavobacteriaceae bacterium]